MTQAYRFLPPGAGTNYAWENDHIFVKASGQDTAGAFTLVEDNLKSTFALGLHVHERHAESFYILEGSVDFYIEKTWLTAQAGAFLHVPPGVPHAAVISARCENARMLMVFQPSGFDDFLEKLSGMTEAELADEAVLADLQRRYDIIQLGPVPDRR